MGKPMGKDGESITKRTKNMMGFGHRPITPEMWERVMGNPGLGYKAMTNAGIHHDDCEDLFSELALPAMLRAARLYDPAKGSFSTLVFRSVLRATWQWRAKQRRIARREADNQEPEYGPLAHTEAKVGNPDAMMDANALLATLSARDRMIVRMRVMDGRKLREIAPLAGVSMQAVGMAVGRAMRRLRRRAR